MNPNPKQLTLPMNLSQQKVPPKPTPPRPTQFPVQPIPNHNNKLAQPMKNVDLQTLHTYTITSVPINEIQLSFRNILNKIGLTVIIQEKQPTNSPLESKDEDLSLGEDENPPRVVINSTTQPKPSQEITQPPYP